MLTQPELDLASDLGELSKDPYRAVLYGFPWGSGDLTDSAGPRKWQREVLDYIGQHLNNPETRFQPCQIAISSGNDVGKSSLIAFIVWWALSTFKGTRVNITANTDNQLKTKTSPELAKWFQRAINTRWFEKTVTSVKVEGSEIWRADLVPWSQDSPAASAGLHNKGKRLLFIIDEASDVPQIIFDTAAPVMLDEDTEIIWLICGNPLHNKGPFYDCVFGKARNRWKTFVLDSRTVEGVNHKKLAEWQEDYGEDSDYFRVHVRGLPPSAESAQFIDQDLIDQAQKRKVIVLPDEPLVAGVDFAWGGADDNVIRFRCGHDAQSIKPIKIKGEFTRDPAVLTGKLADVLGASYVVGGVPRRIAMLFLDSAGIAAPVESRLRQLGHANIVTVNFGAHSPDQRSAYMRDYMWQRMKEWLRDGAIDNDPGLAADLAGPCLVSDKQQRIKLEDKELMKKRGLDSPDDADALALTFAQTVAPKQPEPTPEPTYMGERSEGWMGALAVFSVAANTNPNHVEPKLWFVAFVVMAFWLAYQSAFRASRRARQSAISHGMVDSEPCLGSQRMRLAKISRVFKAFFYAIQTRLSILRTPLLNVSRIPLSIVFGMSLLSRFLVSLSGRATVPIAHVGGSFSPLLFKRFHNRMV